MALIGFRRKDSKDVILLFDVINLIHLFMRKNETKKQIESIFFVCLLKRSGPLIYCFGWTSWKPVKDYGSWVG